MILRNIFLLHQARKNKTNNKYMEKKLLTRTRCANKAIYIIGPSLHAKIHYQTDQFLEVFWGIFCCCDSSLQNVSVSTNN